MEVEVLDEISIENKTVTIEPQSIKNIINVGDILVLTECHTLTSASMCGIPGFNVYYDNANFNSFDGLLVYTKQHLSPVIVTEKLMESSISVTNLSFVFENISLSLHACYRSPNSNTLSFLNDLSRYLENKQNANVNILLGDLNLNILNNNDNMVNQYTSLLNTHGFFSLYEDVTRPDSQTCIDHVFLKTKVKKKHSILILT